VIPLPSDSRVWLANGRTDMRKGMNGLALQVQEVLKRDPHSGHLFVFRGRRGDLLKILWHDSQGICLFSKRLERGRFIWPSPADGVVTISAGQLGYLLEGIDWVRRETDGRQRVQVPYDEGVAFHIGPESCAGGREAVREALTGECAGQPLSREKVDIPGADAVRYAEGHTKGRAIASSPTTRRGRRPWHVQTLFVREPGGLVVDQGGMPRLVRIGKARSRSR